jgi:hypothetical protein
MLMPQRVAILVLLAVAANAILSAGSTLTYVVTIDPDLPAIHVDATAAGLSGDTLFLALKAEAAYVESYISGLRCGPGTPVDAGEGRWSVRTSGRTVTYEYDVKNIVPWRSSIPWSTSRDIGVYVDSECALFMAPYLFVFPERQEFSSIRVKFVVPATWAVATPYAFDGEYYMARRTTTSLLSDFVNRQQFYMGPMRFYAERNAAGCVVTFGQLKADENVRDPGSQREVDAFADATVKTVLALSGLFGENPYDVFTMYTNFRRAGWSFPGTRYFGNGYQYWPEGRWDELIGHTIFAWAGKGGNPLVMTQELAQGVLEDYYGQLLAWELFRDPAYLAKMYWYYLMYEWMYDHRDRPFQSYMGTTDEYEAYFRWEFIALLLDREIRRSTGGARTLADALRWLYERYERSGRVVGASDLERAIREATGVDLSDTFDEYVYGEAKLPVYPYLAGYRQHFIDYVPAFEGLRYHDYPHGHVIALFVDTVLAAALGEHLVWTLQGEARAEDFANEILRRFSLDDLTESDVTSLLSEMTGEDCSGFFTHWQRSYGRLDLADLIAWLRDYSPPTSRPLADESPQQAPSENVRTHRVDYAAPDPYLAEFTFTADAESVCIEAAGQTVWDSLAEGAVEVILRPLGSSSLYRYVARGTSTGWTLYRESVYTKEREPIGKLQAEIEERIRLCIPRNDMITPGTRPGIQIRIKCLPDGQEPLPIWYMPGLLDS